MGQEYKIKGIKKIINKAGKERLAKYYGVDVDADFESIITNDFKENNIPNGIEIALYFSLTAEEYNKEIEEGKGIPKEQDAAREVYEQNGGKRALVGCLYIGGIPEYDEHDFIKMKSGTYGNILYFFIDEPVKMEEFGNVMYSPQYSYGGVNYNGLYMGNAYFEEHKAEIETCSPDKSKIDAVDSYVDNFMKEFKDVATLGGYGPRAEYEETDEIRE